MDVYRGADFTKVASFFGIDDVNFRGGARASGGDLTGDGFADLIAGGGPGGPRVLAFDGRQLLGNTCTPLANFFGGDPNSRGGIRLAVKNLDGDAKADLVVGAGSGAGSRVAAYAGAALAGFAGGGPGLRRPRRVRRRRVRRLTPGRGRGSARLGLPPGSPSSRVRTGRHDGEEGVALELRAPLRGRTHHPESSKHVGRLVRPVDADEVEVAPGRPVSISSLRAARPNNFF